MSNRTKNCKKLRNLFFILSSVTWLAVALVMIFTVLSKIGVKEPSAEDVQNIDILSDQAKTWLLSLSTTAIVGIIASFIIKDKLRTFIWIVSVVLSAVLYKDTGMYIVLGCWLIEEYVFHSLYKFYSNKVSINKEIDLRG